MNIIRVKAFPDAKKQHLEEVSEKVLRIFVREPPKDNRANKQILKIVAEHYTIPENKLRMIAGHQFQNKTIQVLE